MPEEFLQYISAQRRYSPRTCAVYREALEAFYRYAYPLDNAPEAGALPAPLSPQQQLEALTFSSIRGFVAFSMDEGLSPRTVNLRLSALSSYCSWLVRRSLLPSNPVRRIARPKESRRLPLRPDEPARVPQRGDDAGAVRHWNAPFGDCGAAPQRL